jgi:hypothetical protein
VTPVQPEQLALEDFKDLVATMAQTEHRDYVG